MFAICIGNYGYYAEGELRDAWIDLPVDPGELAAFMRERGLVDEEHEETYVSDYDPVPLGLDHQTLGETAGVFELNMLAQVMSDHEEACDVVGEVLGTGQFDVEGVLGLVNLLLQRDEIAYHEYDMPEGYAVSEDDWNWNLGLSIANSDGLVSMLRKMDVDRHFDYASYGEELGEQYLTTRHGYVDAACELPDQRRYSWEEVRELMPWHGTSATHGRDGARDVGQGMTRARR